MNNFYNYKIPYFNEKYGSDWHDFLAILEDNIDYVFRKIWELYYLYDINKMNSRVAEIILEALDIDYNADDTLQIKKLKLRKYIPQYVNKGLGSLYLDIQESIVGVRGEIYNGYALGVFKWGHGRWKGTDSKSHYHIRWTKQGSQFIIYIKAKTYDDAKLDELQALYRQRELLPAFYRIYLVDDSLNILRTV